MPERDDLIKILRRQQSANSSVPVTSPAVSFVSGFVPTYLAIQEALRQEKARKELQEAQAAHKLMLEREKRTAVLSAPLAELWSSFARSFIPQLPSIPAGVYERPELQYTSQLLQRLPGVYQAQLQAQTRLQVEQLRGEIRRGLEKAKSQQDFIKEMERLQKMAEKELKAEFPTETTYGTVPVEPERLLRYQTLVSQISAYRRSAEEGKRIPPEQWEIRKEQITRKLFGFIPWGYEEIQRVVPVAPISPYIPPITTEIEEEEKRLTKPPWEE